MITPPKMGEWEFFDIEHTLFKKFQVSDEQLPYLLSYETERERALCDGNSISSCRYESFIWRSVLEPVFQECPFPMKPYLSISPEKRLEIARAFMRSSHSASLLDPTKKLPWIVSRCEYLEKEEYSSLREDAVKNIIENFSEAEQSAIARYLNEMREVMEAFDADRQDSDRYTNILTVSMTVWLPTSKAALMAEFERLIRKVDFEKSRRDISSELKKLAMARLLRIYGTVPRAKCFLETKGLCLEKTGHPSTWTRAKQWMDSQKGTQEVKRLEKET